MDVDLIQRLICSSHIFIVFGHVCVCVCVFVCIHVCTLPFLTCLSETIAGMWLYLYQEGSGLKGGMSPPRARQPEDRTLSQESRD